MITKKICGFRLPDDLLENLRLASIELSYKQKLRITKTDIVEKALQEFFAKRKKEGKLS